MPPLVNVITREEARKRVKNWRDYAIKLGFNSDTVPKSIFIPRVDIDQAINVFEANDEQGRKASGIRIHFTKKFPVTDQNDDLRLSCIVVTTVKGGKDKLTGKQIHNDAIITLNATTKARTAMAKAAFAGDGGDSGDSEGGETIYDFTSPCPTDCNGPEDWGL